MGEKPADHRSRLRTHVWHNPSRFFVSTPIGVYYGLIARPRSSALGKVSMKKITRSSWVLMPLLFSGALLGQVTLSTVRGVATDTSGAVVAGAGITLTNLETNSKREVKTNGEGDFEIPDLQRGTYRLTAAAAGFKTFIADDI